MSTAARLIHVVRDQKFIDGAYDLLVEARADGHDLVIVGRARPLTYIRSAPVRFVSVSEFDALCRRTETAAVVFHSLPDALIPLLRRIPDALPVAWIGWGFDYYDRLLDPDSRGGLLLPRTRALMDRMNGTVSRRLLKFARDAAHSRAALTLTDLRDALHRVDFFSPALPTEARLARQLNPTFSATYIPWSYGSFESEKTLVTQHDRASNEPTILVGNSGTPENNHLEAFERLRGLRDISAHRILAPLSYGDRGYIREIVRAGARTFGSAFIPLLSFLPATEYTQTLSGCAMGVMNHVRQQAQLNIASLLIQGKLLYLNPASPVYDWLTERGATIRPFLASPSGGDATWSAERLTAVEARTNREVILSHYGRAEQVTRTRAFIERVLEPRANRGNDTPATRSFRT